MKTRWAGLTITAAIAAVVWFALPEFGAEAPLAQTATGTIARTSDGKPDLNGIWQVVNSAHWDIEAHSPEEGVPGGQGVVEGGDIPYQPWALAKKKENYQNRAKADPLSKCYLPGVPRVTYVPLPFEITQTPKHVVIAYEIAHARRIIYTDGSPHVEALEFWMGDSRGKWDGDTLVVDTNNLRDDGWLDVRGSPLTDQARVTERIRRPTFGKMEIDITIEDPKVFTRPWKMSMPIYRRLDKNLQLLDYDCVSFFWNKWEKTLSK
jgi:hypothetical protein